MYCTEEEAKTKWCPQYRIGDKTPHVADNRGRAEFSHPEQNCIASACMMWEEHEEVTQLYTRGTMKGCCGFSTGGGQ